MFPTTRRSAILGTRSVDAEERRASWERVIATYWKPAYKYVRLRRRLDPVAAEDAVQGFFARVLEKDSFAAYDAERGTFRTWLRTCLDGYLANEAAAAQREKRGGGRVVTLDFAAAEAEIARAGEPSAEEILHREWQREIFARALEDLEQQSAAAGRGGAFAIFRDYDLTEERSSYEAVAARHAVPVTTVTNALAAMRRDLRRLVRERLRASTLDDREYRDEARGLLGGAG